MIRVCGGKEVGNLYPSRRTWLKSPPAGLLNKDVINWKILYFELCRLSAFEVWLGVLISLVMWNVWRHYLIWILLSISKILLAITLFIWRPFYISFGFMLTFSAICWTLHQGSCPLFPWNELIVLYNLFPV